MSPADSDTKSGANSTTALAPEPGPTESPTTQPRALLSELAARLAQAVRGLRQDSTVRESLEEVIEESEREAKDLSSQERLMLGNLLKFGELRVTDVMVPRADIVAVEEQTPFADLVAIFREAQHSRLPIYRETLDDPTGMVHIKDVVTLVETGADGQLTWTEAPIAKLKREVLFVPGAMPALDLMMKMQATQIHLAVVVDEYGGTDGLVSIEDLVEEIVGDIDDEHDVDEDLELRLRGDGGFDADARVSLEDFKDRTGIDFAKHEAEDEAADTLGGVVMAALGRVPVRGEIISHDGFEFEILEADARRVKRLPHPSERDVFHARGDLSLRLSFAIADRCATALREARGARRMGFAIVLGVVGAGAFEPLRLFPLLLLSYAGLVLLLDGAAQSPKPFRTAARVAWGYGFGIFFAGLYWIGYAFLVDANAHGWEMPFAVVLMPAGLALFFAGAGALAMLRWRPGTARVFVFALAFFAAEYLRGHILTGFPWNLPAYGWGASPAVLQSASVLGAYGLSLLTLLFGASFALATDRRGVWLPGAMTLIFVGLWAGGIARLNAASDAMVPGVHLRIVQPATPQSEKYVAANLVRNWRRLIDLSSAPAAIAPTHIIWPEAAPPFALSREPVARDEIAALTGDNRVLLTGDVRIDSTPNAPTRFYNSFAIYGPHGKLLGMSDKFHLVPFGEYLPLERTLRAIGLSEIAANTGFSSGPGPQTFSVPGAPPVGPLICYEVIFPREVTGNPRPSWLVNLTDDSWFGPNTGPMQHLLIARVRAIEEGLPIVRSANSGISAVIDAHGRIRASLALGLRGVIDSDLPIALPATPFARFGNMILLGLIALLSGAALWPVRSYQT